MKRCSISLIVREMQIKTAMKYFHTSVRTARIKNGNNNFWQGCQETGSLMATTGIKMGHPL